MKSIEQNTPWVNKHIIVLGAARQGLELARFFLLQGAIVILNDRSPEEKLTDEISRMNAWQAEKSSAIRGTLHWHLGSHPLSLLDGCDFLFASGGVPLALPIVREAQNRNIPISNDSQIFMEAVPCPVIAITGSAGKTTSTTLLGKILTKTLSNCDHNIWVGGNIGTPLIEQVRHIRPADLVLLELSSFQLDLMHTAPHIGAVLNLTPNHLDRHGSMEAYIAAKANLLKYQSPDDWAVLNHEDPHTWELRSLVKGNLAIFGAQRSPLNLPQTFIRNDQIIYNDGERSQFILNCGDIHLRGKHNLLNVLAVCLLAILAGVPIAEIAPIIEDFQGVEHRLELVRIHKDIKWYNDSIATAPERSMAAIRSFNEPLVLLLGGRDKNLPWENMACLVHRRVHDVILFGEASPKIEEALRQNRSNSSLVTITLCGGLEEAVKAAAKIAQPGDVVLLSPGGTSYDEFKDFAERGERYRQWVKQVS